MGILPQDFEVAVAGTKRRGWEDLTPGSIVVRPGRQAVPADDPSPSSDTAAHAFVYRHMPGVGGVVQTHSGYATA